MDDFERIVSEHYEALYRFAFSLIREEAGARDLTQQVFYVWAEKGHQLRERSKVKTWLFTTLHRDFLRARRTMQKYHHYSLDEIQVEESSLLATEKTNEADHSPVLAALARVDKIFQAAVALFYLEEHTYHEISEILQVPMGTVKSRIARGVAQLRNILLPTQDMEKGNDEILPR
jgi:RNA polymerase sigma-70 factor (ECF subfamily)